MRVFKGYMHGVNLGGWLSQCREPDEKHFESFITREDIINIAGMGLDHVRLPVDYEHIEDESGRPVPYGYDYIDKCVGWCAGAGLNVLIDLHRTYGYTFDPLERGADREKFFFDPAMQERFLNLWRRLAERYGKCSNVAFDLLNEVIADSVAEAWNGIAARAVKAIREYAPETWIVIGGVRYNHVTAVPWIQKPDDDRIVFNFHCYEPLVFTHQKAYWMDAMPQDLEMDYPMDMAEYSGIAEAVEQSLPLPEDRMRGTFGPDFFEEMFGPAVRHAEANGAPLYCGEYGVIDQAPAGSTLRWLRDITSVMDRHGIGRALWTYKEMDFGITGPHYEPIRDEMLKLL